MSDSRRPRWIGVLLLALLVLLALGWWLSDRLERANDRAPTEVSIEAADEAERKLERVRTDREEVRLSPIELSSLFRYRAPLWAVSGVDDAGVEMHGDTLVLSGRVATDRLPSHPELDRIRPLLPESSTVEITGRMAPFQDGRAALRIDQVHFAGIPIPQRFYPEVLERIGRSDEPGLGPTALALRLPEGVSAARVEGGHLVLTP
jgi:hypothetical protein